MSKKKSTKGKTLPAWAIATNPTAKSNLTKPIKPGKNMPREAILSQTEKERENMVNKDGYKIAPSIYELTKAINKFKFP